LVAYDKLVLCHDFCCLKTLVLLIVLTDMKQFAFGWEGSVDQSRVCRDLHFTCLLRRLNTFSDIPISQGIVAHEH